MLVAFLAALYLTFFETQIAYVEIAQPYLKTKASIISRISTRPDAFGRQYCYA